MSNVQDRDTFVSSVKAVEKGSAMSKPMHELAEKDGGLFRSGQEVRAILNAGFYAEKRTPEDWSKPEKDGCPAFYNEMKAISRNVCLAKQSNKGLTEAEIADLPDGTYSVDLIVNSKAGQLPDTFTEQRFIGESQKPTTIKRYWSQQVNQWFSDTQVSYQRYIDKKNFVKGGASEQTKQVAQRTVDDLGRALKRDTEMKEGEPLVMGVNADAYIVKLINTIVKTHDGVTLPKFLQTK